jgi:amidohydrolase
MGCSALKAAVLQAIESKRHEIREISEAIYNYPETGYKEFQTTKYIAGKMEKLPCDVQSPGGISGIKATLDTGRPGPGVAILAEMDALVCPDHPHTHPETGAVHACGHNQQVASMLGALMGLVDAGASEHLCGKMHFLAVPAEECIEINFRQGLRERGTIRYLTGKPEFLYRGLFDDVDMCLLIHPFSKGFKFGLPRTFNGAVVKRARYIGKAAHAGGAPHAGINALYAADLGLMAINALRETFRESDCIRVHPIITRGGDSVSVIPDEVLLETFVRGRTLEAIADTNRKVNRALASGALALGADVEIEDLGGYLPLRVDERLNRFCRETMEELVSPEEIDGDTSHATGCTDMGDLSSLMPVAQLSLGGAQGAFHSRDFRIADPTMAVLGAEFLALALINLLSHAAARAKHILGNYTPLFASKESYFDALDSLFVKRVFRCGNCAVCFGTETEKPAAQHLKEE